VLLSLRISKRFDVLIDNAQRLAAGQELNPPLEGQSELEVLDREFRRMSQELENTLRKQRAIVDYAADVICSLNPALSFSEMSTAALAVWGYEPDELIGKRVASIVHADDVERTTNVFEGAQHAPVDSFENRVLRKDGSIVDTRWSVRYVEQEKSLVCVAHDISQRKELERMKQEFVAIVSHDLRSPLTSINMRLGTLAGGMHGDLPEAALKIISTIEGSVVRLIGLINDLLDVEKLESGAWDMRFEEKSFLDTMEIATESLLALGEKKNVEIVLPSNDVIVKADHERLTQVLANIMSNAIKFSPDNSKVIVIQEAKDGLLEVRISDSGPGILDEERALVFDRFRQSKRDSGKKTGSGLGLAICAAIIKEHGGKIGVDSNNGQGSTFWFQIPLERKKETAHS
jgi:PAS domain S-box-containing protein